MVKNTLKITGYEFLAEILGEADDFVQTNLLLMPAMLDQSSIYYKYPFYYTITAQQRFLPQYVEGTRAQWQPLAKKMGKTLYRALLDNAPPKVDPYPNHRLTRGEWLL